MLDLKIARHPWTVPYKVLSTDELKALEPGDRILAIDMSYITDALEYPEGAQHLIDTTFRRYVIVGYDNNGYIDMDAKAVINKSENTFHDAVWPIIKATEGDEGWQFIKGWGYDSVEDVLAIRKMVARKKGQAWALT